MIKGTPEQLKAAVEAKIVELGGDVGIESATNSCNIAADPVMGYDEFDDEFDEDNDWTELASKSVKDSDGFITDYTLYRYDGDPDDVEFPYLCMFGDKELYGPDEGYADWSGETEEEAWDWFDNYGEEDGYSTDAIDSSTCIECEYDDDESDFANISQDELDRLYEIAERYNTSEPVSGDWDTETEHEMNAIADEFGISAQDAKQLMIEYLGFEPEMFEVTDDISDVVESSENPYSDYYENEPSEWWYDHQPCDSYWYHTNHGVQPGSVPNGPGAQVLDIQDDPDGGHFFKFNKLLNKDALDYFDITEKAPRY